MKTKLLLALTCLFSISNAFSQDNFSKGSVLLGGDISFSTYKSTLAPTQSHKIFIFSPTAGVAVKENLFVGAMVGVSYYKNLYVDGNYDSIKAVTFYYGIFVRKYKPLNQHFSIFLQGMISGHNGKETSESKDIARNYYSNYYGVNASLNPGISYRISSKLQLETGLTNVLNVGYTERKSEDNYYYEGIRKETTFNVSSSLNNFTSAFYFGFRLLLQKKST